MLYLVLKSLHVTAMVAWMAAMFVVPLVLVRRPEPKVLAALRSVLLNVTTPSMFLTLGLGLWLAQDAGWFRAGWLQLKLVLVVLLTGLHGVISGQTRRLLADPDYTPSSILRVVPWGVLLCVAAIALLAIGKPELW